MKLNGVYDVLNDLRPQLTYETFLKLIEEAQETGGYKLIGMEHQENLVAIMGYRIICDFVNGRHLYIDDLVSSEKVRSKGFGAILLKHAEKLAAMNGCSNLRLCTGIVNERAKTFYERNSWNVKAVVHKKKL